MVFSVIWKKHLSYNFRKLYKDNQNSLTPQKEIAI